MELNYEVYSLSFLELAILAGSKGINKIFGFPLEEINLESKSDLLLTLHKMVKRDILNSDGETFHIKEPYNEMITIIEQAKSAIVIYPKSESVPMRCCYLGDKILISEISNVQKNTIKYFLINKEYFVDFLEEGYLPEQLDKEVEWIEPKEDFDIDSSIEEISIDKRSFLDKDITLEANQLLRNPEAYLLLDKIEICSGELKNRLIILEKPLSYLIVSSNCYDLHKVVYNMRNVREQLINIIGEEKG